MQTRTAIAIVILWLVAAPTLGAQLDGPLFNWNRGGSTTPPTPPMRAQPDLLARCKLAAPQPPTAADGIIARAGWLPFLHQDRPVARGDVTVVAGLSDVTASCEPAAFQLFVFVGDRYAGTLAPEPMTTGRATVAGAVRLTGDDAITVEFARYVSTDSECCPSSRGRVTYRINRGDTPLVQPMEARLLR